MEKKYSSFGYVTFEDLTDSQRKEYVSIVRKSSIQLLSIVNDIIDISKIEAGQIVVKESAFSLKELLDELSENYTSLLSGSEVSFITELALPENRLYIMGDSTKLRQVITNLISDAIKFSVTGSITLSCRLVKEMIQFCIEDTGSGIDPLFHKTVFERFRQADNGFSRKQEGAGLGLSISKAYVEKMGGEIWIESEPGKGSRFCFNTPANFVEK